jgi:putative endonuclease
MTNLFLVLDMYYYVYILTNKPRGTLYTGFTSELIKRVGQHKSKTIEGFTKRYNLDKLVYFEVHEEALEGIRREKQIKHWKREFKFALIEKENPDWIDLYPCLLDSL